MLLLHRAFRFRIPPHLRGVFTFDGPSNPSRETSKDKTPSPLDIDELMAAVQETKVKVPKNRHLPGITTVEGVPSGQDVPYRKKLKMGPREKYMFKKMRERQRDRPSPNDPASDLMPIYELMRPWSGFSPLKDEDQKKKTKVAAASENYTEEERLVILQIRKTIYGQWEKTSDQQPENTPTVKPPAPETDKVSPNYFRSAESAEKASSSPEHRPVLKERLASRLHRADLTTKRKSLKEEETTTASDSDAEVEEALKADPRFQHDALRLESDSRHIDDVDTWIEALRSFAAKHEKVLEAMQPSEEVLTVPTSNSDNDALGEMGGTLRQSMAKNGINVDKIERQAEEELKRERRPKKKGQSSSKFA